MILAQIHNALITLTFGKKGADQMILSPATERVVLFAPTIAAFNPDLFMNRINGG